MKNPTNSITNSKHMKSECLDNKSRGFLQKKLNDFYRKTQELSQKTQGFCQKLDNPPTLSWG